MFAVPVTVLLFALVAVGLVACHLAGGRIWPARPARTVWYPIGDQVPDVDPAPAPVSLRNLSPLPGLVSMATSGGLEGAMFWTGIALLSFAILFPACVLTLSGYGTWGSGAAIGRDPERHPQRRRTNDTPITVSAIDLRNALTGVTGRSSVADTVAPERPAIAPAARLRLVSSQSPADLDRHAPAGRCESCKRRGTRIVPVTGMAVAGRVDGVGPATDTRHIALCVRCADVAVRCADVAVRCADVAGNA
jgi:hypothetical protein